MICNRETNPGHDKPHSCHDPKNIQANGYCPLYADRETWKEKHSTCIHNNREPYGSSNR